MSNNKVDLSLKVTSDNLVKEIKQNEAKNFVERTVSVGRGNNSSPIKEQETRSKDRRLKSNQWPPKDAQLYSERPVKPAMQLHETEDAHKIVTSLAPTSLLYSSQAFDTNLPVISATEGHVVSSNQSGVTLKAVATVNDTILSPKVDEGNTVQEKTNSLSMSGKGRSETLQLNDKKQVLCKLNNEGLLNFVPNDKTQEAADYAKKTTNEPRAKIWKKSACNLGVGQPKENVRTSSTKKKKTHSRRQLYFGLKATNLQKPSLGKTVKTCIIDKVSVNSVRDTVASQKWKLSDKSASSTNYTNVEHLIVSDSILSGKDRLKHAQNRA
jgi:hypothetical protein